MLPNPYQRVHGWIWTREPRSALQRAALHAARYALALLRDLIEGEISLRAMSLVYTTLLSLVPFLALSFSVLKALGVHNSLQPLLERVLAPLGDQALIVTQSVIGFVDNIKVGVLGSIGVGMLLYTAVSMISKIEQSFNFIWKIGQTRGLTQRFGEYLSVLIIGPVLVFSALGLTASVRSSLLVAELAAIEPFGTTLVLLTHVAPYALIVAAFTFLYAFIPNTRVRLHAAAGGGLFAGVVWESASVGFTTFVSGAGNYSAIYSGFAIVIILLIWLYLGWLIVLFGCRLAFYLQFPRYLSGSAEAATPGSREAEFLALRLMTVITRRFLAGDAPLAIEGLQRQLGVSIERLAPVAADLESAGLLARSAADQVLLPAKDPASYSLADLWRCSRGALPRARQQDSDDTRALALLAALETAAGGEAQQTFAHWLRAQPADPSAPRAP